jgi:hypothetical protein
MVLPRLNSQERKVASPTCTYLNPSWENSDDASGQGQPDHPTASHRGVLTQDAKSGKGPGRSVRGSSAFRLGVHASRKAPTARGAEASGFYRPRRLMGRSGSMYVVKHPSMYSMCGAPA